MRLDPFGVGMQTFVALSHFRQPGGRLIVVDPRHQRSDGEIEHAWLAAEQKSLARYRILQGLQIPAGETALLLEGVPAQPVQMIGLPDLAPCQTGDEGTDGFRRDVKETFHDVRPPVIVQPAAGHHEPVEMILGQAGERHAVRLLGRAEALVDTTLSNAVQIGDDELGVGNDPFVRVQIRQLTLGRFAGIRKFGLAERQV